LADTQSNTYLYQKKPTTLDYVPQKVNFSTFFTKMNSKNRSSA